MSHFQNFCQNELTTVIFLHDVSDYREDLAWFFFDLQIDMP